MKNPVVVLIVLFCAALSLAQENYAQWFHYRPVAVNTTSGGANVTGAVSNFPLLVRLTSAQSDIFAQSLAGGADIRFADSTGLTPLKYQKERWDSAGQVAEFWVLLPVISGNASTAFRMYWGKTGATDQSSGSGVFDSSNGFRGVWHLGENASPSQDATVFGSSAGWINSPASATGVIGNGVNLLNTNTTSGTAQFLAASYNTANDNFKVSSAGGVTLSAWINRTAVHSTAVVGIDGIAGRFTYANSNHRQFALSENNATSYTITSRWTTDGVSNETTVSSTANASNTWYHLVATFVNGSQRLYKNGVAVGTAGTTASLPQLDSAWSDGPFTIGKLDSATGNYQFFNGIVDEVELSRGVRSADWIQLSYQTQKTGATAVTLGTAVSLAVPGVPTAVTDTAGNGQAVVVWAAPSSNGGSPITGYTVTAVQDTGKHCTTTGSLTCTVIGLTNGTAYSFTVTAKNLVGTGSASAASALVTPAAPVGVPAPPTGTAAVGGNAQATVSWTAPAGTVTGYLVTSSPDGKTCGTTSALTCIVTGLTNGTPYTFTVVASNSTGPSAASTPSSAITPAGPPGAPTSVTGVGGNAQVILSWVAPASTGGAAITGYKATSVADTGKHCATTGSLTCTITGLTNGTTYTFTVTATNSAGTGSPSAASAGVTPTPPPTIPGAPINVTGVGASGQVTVSWAAPASSGGSPITGYTVKEVQDTTYGCTTTGALSCVVNGLINLYSYTFVVTATNSVGTGPASAPSAFVSSLAPAPREIGIHLTRSNMMLNLPEITGSARLSIVDIRGQVVWSRSVDSRTREISLGYASSGIVPGLYIVRLTERDARQKPRLAAESKILLTP